MKACCSPAGKTEKGRGGPRRWLVLVLAMLAVFMALTWMSGASPPAGEPLGRGAVLRPRGARELGGPLHGLHPAVGQRDSIRSPDSQGVLLEEHTTRSYNGLSRRSSGRHLALDNSASRVRPCDTARSAGPAFSPSLGPGTERMP